MRLKGQPDKDEPPWRDLKTQLTKSLNSDVSLVFPKVWDDKYLEWFEIIEHESFRVTLRYTPKEVEERLMKRGILLMFLLADSKPEALLLGYNRLGTFSKTFYLDTIAVRQQNIGIGSAIIEALASWARGEDYLVIELDTEVEDEKGIKLRNFYEKLGFSLVATEDTGNLTMKRLL